MAFNIGPTIAVKGESEFNSAMVKIKTNMKLISSEAGVMTAQFKGNENSIQALTAKDKLLNESLKEQKRAVTEAENALQRMKEAGVDPSSKAYLEMRTNLNHAEAALKDTEREIKDNEQALKRGGRATKDFSQDLHSFAQAAGKVALGAAKAFAIGIGAIATAAVFAAKKVYDMTVGAGNWADEVLTMSKQTDLSVQTLQELAYAARFVDVDVGTMTKGMGRVVAQMREATNKGKDFIEVTGGLKISMVDANGELKTTEQMFYDTIDALGEMTNETERDIAAQEIFGKSYQDIKPLIDAGSESLLLYAAEAKKAGIILGDEAVEKLGKFDDQMERTTAKLETAGRLAAVNFLPAIDGIVSGVSEILSTITTALADGFQDGDITTISDAITKQIQNAMDGVAKNAPAFIGVITNVLSSLVGMIVNMLPTLLPLLASSLFQLLNGLFQTISQNAAAISTAVVEIVTMMVLFITENMPMIVETGMTILLAVSQGLLDSIPTLIPAIVDMVTGMALALTDPSTLAQLVVAAFDITIAIIQGLWDSLPQLLGAALQIVVNLALAFAEAAPQLWENGKAFITQMADGISAELSVFFSKIGTWIDEKIIQPFKDKVGEFVDVGANILKGIWNGINDTVAWLKEQIEGVVDKIKGWFTGKDGFDEGSPSKWGKTVGRHLFEGIGIGGKSAADGVLTSMQNSIRRIKQAVATGLSGALSDTMGAVGGVTINATSRGAQGRVSGGITIGKIEFNTPVESPVQAASLIERRMQELLYA